MLDRLTVGQSTCSDLGGPGRVTLISVVVSDDGGRLHGRIAVTERLGQWL